MRLALKALEALPLAWRAGGSSPAEVKRLLVLGYSAVGDLVFLLPFLEALRKGLPKARITFTADPGPTTLELLPAAALVDEIKLIDPFKPGAPALETAFDAAVLTLATPAHLFQRELARIPLRVGHVSALTPPPGARLGPLWSLKRALVSGEGTRRLLLNRTVPLKGGEHAARRNLRLLEGFGLPVPEAPPRPAIPIPPSARAFAEKELGPGRRKRVAIHLGVASNQYHKMWPAERFGRLARRLEDAGLECFLVGGPQEAAAAAEAAKGAGRPLRSWAGRAGLLESFALIAASDLMVSNDTGLAKAAMAMGVPTATIWGPIDPGEYGIVWEPEKHLDIRLDLACSPCARMGMPYPRTDIDYTRCPHYECLNGIHDGMVFEAIRARHPRLLAP